MLGGASGTQTLSATSRTIAEYKRQSLLVETSPNVCLLDIPNLRRIAEE